MQIIKLLGGLGNQMFEYAFIKAYSLKNNCDFLLDLSWFEENKNYEGLVAKRVYELGCFKLPQNFATKSQVEKCINHKKSRLPKFLCKLLKKEKYTDDVFRDVQACVYSPNLLEAKENAYFNGYFQSEKYFKEYRNEILKGFTLNITLNEQNKQMLEKIKLTNSVSLHVRRGDYVNLQDIHGLCTLDYYKKAIEYIVQNIQNPYFFIFSDDVKWVQENLKIDNSYIIVDINDTDNGCFDLELMKNCKHNIIANSSLSWWGAWLNQNQNKIVIAPQKWFANPDLRSDDIIPESWVKL